MIASVLPPQPALNDVSTTREELEAANALAKVTSPPETPLFISYAMVQVVFGSSLPVIVSLLIANENTLTLLTMTLPSLPGTSESGVIRSLGS
ncbi:hypothetical protein DFS33DRAFT_1379750 [Desarmillaria ectypa]|nr:hypothetical protein DFS33DRAFT_1379750 [Desarmillaria ectypa]